VTGIAKKRATAEDTENAEALEIENIAVVSRGVVWTPGEK
jgi:hypothetical protein